MQATPPTNHYRAIFLSDIHLGTRGCKADFLLDFLRHTDADEIYLIGDIIDCWRLKQTWFWMQSHNDVVQKLLRKARKGTKVTYVPGNHDEPLRDYDGMAFGGVMMVNEAVHVTADGKRMLIVHGDAFDGIVKYARWLAKLGDHAYAWCLRINHWYNHARLALGVPEDAGQGRGQVHQRLRECDGGGSEAPRPRRRDLRPHPQGRDEDHRRHSLLQRRRLGGELHRLGRASRRQAGDHRMGGAAAVFHAGAQRP